MKQNMEKLKILLKEGWKVTFEDGSAYADRGDFNCPHKKEYDPKDGHGVSQVWTTDEYEGVSDEQFIKSTERTFEECINVLYERCKAVIPGKPYEKQNEKT